jgi:teichuronic acid exporter
VSESTAQTTPPPANAFSRAVSWSYVLNVGRITTTLVLSLVLARLLGPEAFGLIAMANVYVMFVELLVRQGLFVALVQRPGLTDRHLDTAFWLTVAAVTVLTPLSMLASVPWAAMNRLPDLAPVIVGLSLLVPLRGLSVVQEAIFHRKLNYKVLAIRGNVATVIGGVVGLGLALGGAGVWSLVAQQLVAAGVELVMIWYASSWRPSRRYAREDARELLGFGSKTILASFGNFANHRADALLIGLLFGPVAVGLYRMAARLIETALDFAIGGIQTVSLPELSKFVTDPPAFRRRALELMRLVAVIAAPAYAILAVSSDALFRLLGDEWAAAADPLKLLALLGFTAAVFNLAGPILDASGRPGLHAALMWVGAAVSVATFTAAGLLARRIGGDHEVLLLAAFRTATFVVTAMLVALPLLRRALGLSTGDIARATLPALLGATAGGLAAVAALAGLGLDQQFRPLVAFVLTGSIATFGCGVGLLLTDAKARQLAKLGLQRAGLTRPVVDA